MKPGWKTTEFWATATLIAALLGSWLGERLDGDAAVVASALVSGLYAVSRGLAKGRPDDAQVRDQVLDILNRGDAVRNGVRLRDGAPGDGAGGAAGR